MRKLFIRISVFILLTILTQIGGVVYLLALALGKMFSWNSRLVIFALFIVAYISASFATTYLAPLFGRHPLPCLVSQTAPLKIANPIFCALNRQYVKKDLLVLLEKASGAVDARFKGTQTLVLDANFPFFDGFPLLPHLSHHDGRKVDLAFYYMDGKAGYLSGYMKSPVGYWGYSQPKKGTKLSCTNVGFLSLRWDFVFLQPYLPEYLIEPQRTSYLLKWLVGEGRKYGMEKVLLESHLKSQLGVSSDLIRFQGCRAARHDDHIHLQIGK